MKLATFEIGGAESTGIVVDGGIVDAARHGLPRDMIALIAGWPELKAKAAAAAKAKPDYRLDQVRLKAPVPRPQKVMAIGLNYADHIAESGAQTPEKQIWFAKLGNAINGPYDPIQIPKASKAIDWEAEMVFVIGQRCRHVPKE
ncbi:MAG TPA: fumarylacetoacetate hydrolase family protein, partial [Rhizomicrobium sp.]